MRTEQDKINTVIERNTYFFSNKVFEQRYEGYISMIKETLLNLKQTIDCGKLTKDVIINILKSKEYGLCAILALTGLSNESFKRLLTLVSVVDDNELSTLVHKSQWCQPKKSDASFQEISDAQITKLLSNNDYFVKGVVNLFFEGSSTPYLVKTLPLFELKKLSLSKLKFEVSELIDTLVRYKEKGSYAGKVENNAEAILKEMLNSKGIKHSSGDLKELIKKENTKKRTMDFLIPDKDNPKIIIESSYLVTTSSGQGDKAKAEIAVRDLLKLHYPNAKFIGLVDGIGWYVRRGDLVRMVSAFDDVFTLHPDEIIRLVDFIEKELY